MLGKKKGEPGARTEREIPDCSDVALFSESKPGVAAAAQGGGMEIE